MSPKTSSEAVTDLSKTTNPAQATTSGESPKLSSVNLNFFYGSFQALHGISLDVHKNKVTAFIGPSGCGKSTFLRTLNRMNETIKGTRVDGNRLPTLKIAAEAIVKGDAKVKAISAASILAKVHRDRLCLQLHEQHPQYGFHDHKGYGTPAHLAALRAHGACPEHRRSFAPVREVL